MSPENVTIFVNPRKGYELTGEYNCIFCNTFHTRLAQLPGTDYLICKSCTTALTNAIDANYQEEFRSNARREPRTRRKA